MAPALPYAEVEVRIEFLQEGRLPAFRGATLRGGLGYHLKRTVCHVRPNDCTDCIVRPTCVYSYIFEGIAPEDREVMRLYPFVPQPFAIITDLENNTSVRKGESWDFGLRLFGRAIEHFPYVAYSLMELGKCGLGRDKIGFSVQRIVQTGRPGIVYANNNNRLSTLQRQYLCMKDVRQNRKVVTVEFVTPARLRIGGYDARQVNFGDIIRAAVRRLSILTHFYGHPLDRFINTKFLVEKSCHVEKVKDSTKWFEFSRYSGRQEREMQLGGLVGKVSFRGELGPFMPLLALTEIAHIGKATSFGFGRIAVS